MYSIAFFLIGLAQCYFLNLAVKSYRAKPTLYLPLAILCLAALTYDCWAIAAGGWLGEGETLKLVSYPRFYTHALFTPLLIIYAFGVAKRLGAGWGTNIVLHSLICIFALFLITLGVREDIFHLTLIPKVLGDSVRYANGAASGPPIPAILVNVFFLLIGGWLFFTKKSPWFFAGSLFMFLVAPFTPRFPLLGNVGELGISFAIISGERLLKSESNLIE